METIVIQVEPKKAKAIKQFLKAFDVSFKTNKKDESPYDPEFVEMILNARKNKVGERVFNDEYKKELFDNL